MSSYSMSCVPCVEIRSTNLSLWWKQLIQCIEECHFVAIDLELSGLGPRDKLNAKQIDERYEGVLSAAKTRSVVSIGFAFFNFCDNNSKVNTNNENVFESNTNSDSNDSNSSESKPESTECLIDSVEHMNRFEALDSELMARMESEANLCLETDLNSSQKEWNISAKVFNMLCLCEDEYICEPETLRFLAGHGFDFNGQCLHGLSYRRGNDTEYEDFSRPSLRNLISLIIAKKAPIVLHNGFIDLVFLYQSFYSDLPNDLQTFIADLVELFPNGVFDTKYISDFHERRNPSYLEYLFYERQRFNIERAMKGQVNLQLLLPVLAHNLQDIEFKDLSTKLFSESNLLIDICSDYANHGWCKLNHLCSRSHNIDHILDKKKNRSNRMKKMIKKLKRKSVEQSNESTSGGDNSSTNTKQAKVGVHRAGYDAFMTGYCLAFYIAINAKSRPDPKQPINAKSLGISQIVNNIYLTGKDQSLRLTASSFAKTSSNHKNKILRLRSLNS